jgi:hypothetical protein
MDQVKLLEDEERFNKELHRQMVLYNKMFTKVYAKVSVSDKVYIEYYKGSFYTDINGICFLDKMVVNPYEYKNILKLKTLKFKWGPKGLKVNYPKGFDKEALVDRIATLLVKINNRMELIIQKCPRIKATKLYKGIIIKKKSPLIKLIKKGSGTYTFSNLCSTSLKLKMAASFSSESYDGNRYVFSINMKESFRALFLPWNIKNIYKNTFSSDEFELLLPHGLQLKMKSIKKIKMITGQYDKIKTFDMILVSWDFIGFDSYLLDKDAVAKNMSLV